MKKKAKPVMSESPRRLRSFLVSAKTRAVLSLGIILGLGSVSTMAYWTDTATMTTGSISAGTLDLKLGGNLAGQGGTWNNTSLALTDMVPGESVAKDFTVQNAGAIGLTWTATAAATGDLALSTSATSAQRLQFAVYVGGTSSNSGTAAAGNRTGTCTGTVAYGPAALTSTQSSVVSTAQSLAASGSQNVCIKVSLPSAAPNALQGTTATATFIFNATQVGA